MKTSPLVSVIINTRNRPQLILRAVESVLSQDYPNFELLLVDASTNEETKEVARSIEDKRMKYIRIDDEDYFAKTFFYAISLTEGKYVAFNDDDDEWISPQKLSKQVDLIESLPEEYGVVYCWWGMWYDDINAAANFPNKTNRGNLFDQMLYDNAIHGTPSLLVKRHLFDDISAIMDRADVLPSDHFMMTLISRKYKFDFVPEVLVRCHERHGYGSMGRTPTARFSMKSRVNLQLQFLSQFHEGYKINHRARRYKYEIIVSQSIRGRFYRLFVVFLAKHLLEFHDIVFSVKSVARFAVHLFGLKKR